METTTILTREESKKLGRPAKQSGEEPAQLTSCPSTAQPTVDLRLVLNERSPRTPRTAVAVPRYKVTVFSSGNIRLRINTFGF